MTDKQIILSLTRELEAALRLDGVVICDKDGNTLDWEIVEGVVEVETASSWISVHDQMPPCGENVLVWDGNEIEIDFTDIEVEFGTEFFSNTQNYTTHWQPLPEPFEVK